MALFPTGPLLPECLDVRNVPSSQMQHLTVHLSGECHICCDSSSVVHIFRIIRQLRFYWSQRKIIVITPASSVNECTIVRYLLNLTLNCILDVSRIISSIFLLVASLTSLTVPKTEGISTQVY